MVRRAQEDLTPNKGGASKRKLKKDRRAKRQELADEAQSECVTWDEDQAVPEHHQTGVGWGGVEPCWAAECQAEAEVPGWPAAGAASAQANGLGYLCGRT